MSMQRAFNAVLAMVAVTGLAACGGNMFSGSSSERSQATAQEELARERERATGSRDSIWDLFGSRQQPETTLVVNRYLWTAALDVLDFLPVENVDPFSGVFTTGFGTPPGGGRPYRATVHVSDGALDARSLNVALVTRTGTASSETVRAVENAILTRARQLRIQDRRL
ncbi:MAG: DUF3576 domain-containing protein [Pararhodobacter sp.]|nr:DUF3576 domain-containing protein [Pararhodobacter sp.]